jgi:GxxExxY protein
LQTQGKKTLSAGIHFLTLEQRKATKTQNHKRKIAVDEMKILCDTVREIGFAIHCFLGPGHLEKVYENALFHRLMKAGLQVRPQFPLHVYDEDGTLLGDYSVDLLVNDVLLIEIKAAKDIANEHIAQILGYLRSSRREHGLLINFGAAKFQIKKFILNRWQPAND